MFEDDDMVFAAMSAGAAGYLLKGADGTDIITAVRAAGQAVFGPALAGRMRAWFASGRRSPAEPFPQLTQREREILDGVAAGLTNAQIGQQRFLSAKDRGQQRVEHTRQAPVGRAGPGHCRRPRCWTRPPGRTRSSWALAGNTPAALTPGLRALLIQAEIIRSVELSVRLTN
jgi:regulatory LuxR family protein